MTLCLLVAEDQALVRAGFVTILRTDSDIEVVAEAVDGEQAVQLAVRHRPDVALLDVRMPRLDGLAATRQIRERVPATAVLVLTTCGEDEVVFRAVAAGEGHLDPAVTAAVVAHFREHRTPAPDGRRLTQLTAREAGRVRRHGEDPCRERARQTRRPGPGPGGGGGVRERPRHHLRLPRVPGFGLHPVLPSAGYAAVHGERGRDD